MKAFFTKLFTIPKSAGVLIVVLCATLGYYITISSIKSNLIQYPDLPKSLLVKLSNGKTFNLPVDSKMPIDTVKLRPVINNSGKVCENILFHQNPSMLLWAILICITVAIAAGAAPFFIFQIFELKNKFSLSKRRVWVGGVLYAALIDLFLINTNGKLTGYYEPPEIIDGLKILFIDGQIITHIVGAILLLILPGLSVMFLIATASDNIYIVANEGVQNTNTSSIKSIEDAVKKLKYLHKALQNTLQILAIIVVFSVLTTGALGESIKSTVSVHGLDLYPSKASYVYGLYFSLFLCIIYVPLFYYLKSNFIKLQELASDPSITAPTGWYTSLFGDIKFEGNALESIKLAFTIIAPILTSFLPNATEFLK